MRKLTLPAIVILALGFIAVGAATSDAGCRRGYYNTYYGGNYGWGGNFGWHDTTHLDYHPAEYIRHGNHYHYQPAHYDVHRTGHWDNYGW